jgi:stage II sporulation protein D
LLVLCAFLAGMPGGRAADAGADAAIARYAAAAGEPDPLIRVGFDDGARVRIEAAGGIRILDPATGRDVWRARYDGEIVLLPEGAPANGPGTVFRIQVGAYGSEEAARTERDRLAGEFGVPAVVRYVPDRGSWRVRIGEASDRDGLAGLLERLRASGRSGLWIAEEPAREVSGVTLRLVDGRTFESMVTPLARLVIVPVGRDPLRLDDVRYRGVIEVRVTPYGTVRAVNWVHLEHYLLGVVPAELGPEVWPRIEALRAQAVAARTYAWRNLDQFDEDGFDQCATPRCQVYKGKDAEHPLSDRAVTTTRGEVLTWDGRAINAMFTATCGGHTEDAAEIFPEEQAPYLKGVPCRAEAEALRSHRFTVVGREPEPVIDRFTGLDVSRDRALLAAAGIVEDGIDTLLRPIDAATLERWSRAFRVRAGLVSPPPPDGERGPIEDLGDAAARLVAGVGWTERADVLLAAEDLAAVVRDPDVSALAEDRRRALAYLVRAGALTAGPGGRFGADAIPDGTRLLPSLLEAGERYALFELREGTVGELRPEGIRVFRGKGEATVPLSKRPRLFGRSAGRAVEVGRLELWPGDRIRYRVGPSGAIDFLELQPPVAGVSDDRSASVYSWDLRMSRRDLERSIRKRVDVGTLTDLRVIRRGVSGRVVELEVVGTRGTERVRGFDIRRLLGLRESLVVFEIQRRGDGTVDAVTFSGKGWGHGIGLCQVGAYGMALRGASYRDILGHYYSGARIERAAVRR